MFTSVSNSVSMHTRCSITVCEPLSGQQQLLRGSEGLGTPPSCVTPLPTLPSAYTLRKAPPLPFCAICPIFRTQRVPGPGPLGQRRLIQTSLSSAHKARVGFTHISEPGSISTPSQLTSESIPHTSANANRVSCFRSWGSCVS